MPDEPERGTNIVPPEMREVLLRLNEDAKRILLDLIPSFTIL